MIDLIRVATAELARFLTAKLPELSTNWWQKNVLDRLTTQQQRSARDCGWRTMQQLDLAALQRVFDQNWNELSTAFDLPREGRNWVKELQTVRNRWAHLPAEAIPADDIFRDADTIGRVLKMIGAGKPSLEAVEFAKATAVTAMSRLAEAPIPATPSEPFKMAMVPLRWSNKIGMEFVLIKPGRFQMGNAKRQPGDDRDEFIRDVELDQPYYLGKTAVTQKQWRDVMGTNPWQGRLDVVPEGDDYAATWVSWVDALDFCRNLTEKGGKTYRLPTETEWEYACRGGMTTRFSFGDDDSQLGQYAWYATNAASNNERYAHEVGRKKPNPFGLYDMHGNVWEWCDDPYFGVGEEQKVPAGLNPKATEDRTGKVLRGGCWFDASAKCSSASRFKYDRLYAIHHVGFRVACNPS